MLYLAIVDNNQDDIKVEYDILTKWSSEFEKEIEIHTFTSGPDFLNYCNMQDFWFDLVFLDIQLPVMGGMEIAQHIRKLNKECAIIFVTNYCENVYDGYRVRAFRYIVKNKLEPALYEAMNSILPELEDTEQYFFYQVKKKTVRIQVKNIIYFESRRRKIEIHVNGEAECREFYGQLSEIEERLNAEDFVRCHQSYIINMRYVKGLVGKGVNITNYGIFIPVSKKYRETVEKKILWLMR